MNFSPLHPCKLLRNIQPQTGASPLSLPAPEFFKQVRQRLLGNTAAIVLHNDTRIQPIPLQQNEHRAAPGCVLKRIGKQVQHDPVQTLRIAQQTARTFGAVFKPQRNAARLSVRSGALHCFRKRSGKVRVLFRLNVFYVRVLRIQNVCRQTQRLIQVLLRIIQILFHSVRNILARPAQPAPQQLQRGQHNRQRCLEFMRQHGRLFPF